MPVTASPFTPEPQAFAVERILADRVLAFVESAGIAGLLATRGRFGAGEALTLLHERLGYQTSDAVRARMLRVLLDFLSDCGRLTPTDGGFAWNAGARCAWRTGAPGGTGAGDAAGGELGFFQQCLDYAGRFLEGAPPLFDFGADSIRAWDELLGNGGFMFARSVLARLLLPRAPERATVLVLCYGPGYDLVEVERRRPDARVTALDVASGFRPGASARLQRPDAVTWVDSTRWGGFGTPLPFPPETFDIALFSCADPYIETPLRDYVYADIRRVLGPRGTLGVLTHSYPDAARQVVSHEWVRRGTFCHDFLESVCRGWQGFRDADSSRAVFARVGFGIDVLTLNASVWRLAKAGAR